MKIIAHGLLFIFILVLIYGILVEPYSLDIEEQYSTLPELPSGMDICRIAVMGDLQVGMWMDNIRTIQKAVDWITL